MERIRAAENRAPETRFPLSTIRKRYLSPRSATEPRGKFSRGIFPQPRRCHRLARKTRGLSEIQGLQKGVVDAALGTAFGLEKHFEISRDFDRNAPDSFDFGITRAAFAIAESGAVILKDSSTSDRLAGIAPWVHVAVVEEKSIVRTIPEGLAKWWTARMR